MVKEVSPTFGISVAGIQNWFHRPLLLMELFVMSTVLNPEIL